MADALRLQQIAERRCVESPLARLDDHRLPRQGGKFRHQIIARLAIDKDAPHRAAVADGQCAATARAFRRRAVGQVGPGRSEEHTYELQSLMRISYAVLCLKKKNNTKK